MLLGRIEKELATTKRVIGNIPNDKRDYKPHPVCRSAWELATHLAQSDIWFLNGIASRNFEFTGEPPAPADTVAGLVDWYDREAKQAAARVRNMSAEELRSLFEGEYWLLSSEAKRSGAGFLLKQRLAHVRRELSAARAARVNNTHGRHPS